MAKSGRTQAGQVLRNSGKVVRVGIRDPKTSAELRTVSVAVAKGGGELKNAAPRAGRVAGPKPSVENVMLVGPTKIQIGLRADTVAKALGSRTKLAQLLKVSVSQPTRWIKGDESPNSENTRTIVDLEHVVTRARLLWGDDEVVNAWLTGRNGFLDGARPIDVIATEGSGPVIDALDQATAGAFA